MGNPLGSVHRSQMSSEAAKRDPIDRPQPPAPGTKGWSGQVSGQQGSGPYTCQESGRTSVAPASVYLRMCVDVGVVAGDRLEDMEVRF